jgi:phosphoglycolate phosphatase-like HAD superfamily hydrolase
MSQFGAATTITTRTRLILLDCFETLIHLEGKTYRPRNGVVDFLIWFRDRQPTKLVVISDAEKPLVEDALSQAGLSAYVMSIYHAGNALEPLSGGRVRKRLDVPLKELGISAAQTVFIGDSPLDAEAAAHYQVPFIRVPRSEDRSFTFASLIRGPSRYNSQEFSATFLDQYRQKPSRDGQ